MPGHNGNSTELTHGPGVAKNQAIEKAPTDRRQSDVPKGLPTARAEGQRRLFLLRARGFHDRDQFARDEWKGDEDRGEDHARDGEKDFEIWFIEPPPKNALRPDETHEHKPAKDGRSDEGKAK